jgi:hypothetical protein
VMCIVMIMETVLVNAADFTYVCHLRMLLMYVAYVCYLCILLMYVAYVCYLLCYLCVLLM